MKLVHEGENVEVMGDVETGEFRIKSSPKAFHILSSGLYSDKVLAVVRELSCNAYDSHIEAGNTDPFTVHFPTTLTPEFWIRDYGVGLDHEGVMEVYTTYFESTKQNSNDYVGALGLGSKSPFAYTKNFTITAIKDGVQNTYSAMIDEHGIPNIILLDTCDTDEGNGVKVGFGVKHQDFYKFKDAGQKVYRWFDMAPEIKGDTFEPTPVKLSHIQIVPGVDIRDEHYGGPLARQGVVVYPLRPNKEDIDEDLHELLDVPFVIDFPIGALDVAASREELQYVAHTNRSINTRLREIQDGLIAYVKKELKGASTDWEKILILDKMQSNVFKPIISALIDDPKKLFKSIEIAGARYGTPLIQVMLTEAWQFARYTIRTRNHQTKEIRLSKESWRAVMSEKDDNGQRDVVGEAIDVHAPSALIFHNDTGKRNVLGRVRLYCKDNQVKRTDCFVVTTDSPAALKKAKAALGQAPMIKCSDLEEPPKYSTSAGATTKISLLKLTKNTERRDQWSYRDIPNWMWSSETNTLVAAAGGKKTLYVPLKNRTVITPGDTEMPRSEFFSFMDTLKAAGLIDEDIEVYGVRKSVIKEITSDYVNLFEEAKRLVAALSVHNIADNVRRASIADMSTLNEDQMKIIKRRLGNQHALSVIADAVIGSGSIEGPESPDRVHEVTRLASELNITLDVLKVKDKAEKEGVQAWDDMMEAYPMIRYLADERDGLYRSNIAEAVVDYVLLVDKAA